MKSLFSAMAVLCALSLFGQGQFQNEAYGSLKGTTNKLVQLAEAIPAEKFEWAPAEGVRSIAGVFGHAITANYFFASRLGGEMPTGVDMKGLGSGTVTDKETIIRELKKSNEFALLAVKGVKNEDLGNEVEFPIPGDYTVMTATMILMTHCNEHLGQMIAYARINEITPPWSESEEK